MRRIGPHGALDRKFELTDIQAGECLASKALVTLHTNDDGEQAAFDVRIVGVVETWMGRKMITVHCWRGGEQLHVYGVLTGNTLTIVA